MADADLAFEGTSADDQVGDSVAGEGDLDGDGIDDVAVAATGLDSTASDVGQVYIFTGAVTSGLLSDADATFSVAEAGESVGSALAFLPDLDADGDDELLVGAHLYDGSAGTDAGRVYLLEGGTTGTLSSAATFEGDSAYDSLGSAVACAGDVNGDGTADVLLGAYGDDPNGSNSGTAVPWYGGAAWGAEAFADADMTFTGDSAVDQAGFSVAGAGDVDGDGFDDLLIGAYGDDIDYSGDGAAYLIFGPPAAAALDPAAADLMLYGEGAGDQFGYTVAGVGDTDADGRADIAVGANYTGTRHGAVYVWTTGFVHTVGGDVAPAGGADAILEGGDSSDQAGSALAGLGDFDGNGHDDLAIGAAGAGGTSAEIGAVYLTYGPIVSSSLTDLGYRLSTSAVADGAGLALAGGGDSNADGYDDLLFGARWVDTGVGSGAGTAWLYYGGTE